ncbi:hypothetical protein IJ182_07625 [bacterium]|nr:hypothetical protein [bacterium]
MKIDKSIQINNKTIKPIQFDKISDCDFCYKDNNYKNNNSILLNNNAMKPASLLKNDIQQVRQKHLTPITSEKEYDELLQKILSYKIYSEDSDIPEKCVCIWGYENTPKELQGLIAYCGSDDRSEHINSWLAGRNLPMNKIINEGKIIDIIRCFEYSLGKLDEKYGKYRGVVYRSGFFNPLTDKQFYSTSADSFSAIKHVQKELPSKKTPYSIIRIKSGHNINAFQKDTKSFISKRFSESEKEILIDRKSKFRLVPESEYTETDKRLKTILLTQAVKKTDEIKQKDITQALNEHSDLLKYISIWEETE